MTLIIDGSVKKLIRTTDILVYQLPFPLFCNFAIDIFKHLILRLIFLHITYSYSFHCILRHILLTTLSDPRFSFF